MLYSISQNNAIEWMYTFVLLFSSNIFTFVAISCKILIVNKTLLWSCPNDRWCSILLNTFDFFSVRLLSVLRGHSVFSSPPQRPMTSDFEGFSIPDFTHYIYFNSWERASMFPFECSVLNNGTTGTIFITSLVWRSPWLGIEPGTSRTRSQHSTTRLSRRRFFL